MNDKFIQINYLSRTQKFFRKHLEIREEFEEAVTKVLRNDHPEQVNYKKLQGEFRGYWRIAIRSYRIMYTVENGEIIIVSVVAAGSRGDIYKHL